MKNTKFILFLVSIIFVQISISGKDEVYFFDQISLKEGLSQSTVKTIYRDKIGLLWVGTKDGLNVYDGTRIRTYLHDPKNDKSLPDNNISFIIEDTNYTLWIGSSGALCRYDRENDNFIKEKVSGEEISVQSVLPVATDIFFTSQTKLYQYNTKEKNWKTNRFKGKTTNISASSTLESWGKNHILIGSRWNGLFICNTKTGEMSKSPLNHSGNYILDTYRDSGNRIWVSQYGKGVYCYSNNGKKLLEITPQNTNLPCDKVMKIMEYQGKMWMATDGYGILIYNIRQNNYEFIRHNQSEPYSLPSNSLLTIYKDQYENLWLGSIRSGLIGVRNVHAQTFADASLNSTNGLSNKTVLCFLEGGNDNIWIGTDGEGINLFNQKTRKFKHFPATFNKKVSSITSFSSNELLLSFYKEGLKVFNTSNGQISNLIIRNKTNLPNWNGLVGINVLNTNNGYIYLAEDNVFKYRIRTGEISKIKLPEKHDGSKRIVPNPFNKNEIYLFSNYVIRKLNLSNDISKVLFESNESTYGIINNIDIDKDNHLWIGTSTGLYLLSGNKPVKKCTNQINSVSLIISDKNKYLWIGSGLELYRYDKKNDELFNYGKADGVIQNEYLPKSKLLTSSGEIYLGGVEGFVRILKKDLIKNKFNPKFELLNVMIDGSLHPVNHQDKDEIISVDIPWNHSSIVVNYFINTPELGVKRKCRYYISGFNDTFTDAPNHSINLQKLTPGQYKLQLSYELKNNIWSENTDLIQLNVLPPWWGTWWFYTLTGILIIAALMLYRQSAINKAKRSMEIEMQLKEKDLYEQKVKFLINISHELRTPLTLVYSPLSRILKENIYDSATLQPMLMTIYKNIKNIKNTINMVLDVRKLEYTDSALQISTYEVHPWLNSITKDFSLEFDSRKIHLALDFDPEINSLNFDRDKCEKIISNLLMNALKFSESDSTITIKTKMLENAVRFSVCDEGSGVPPEDVDQLFVRFYQGNHQKGGTGIGLSYSKSLIELHGGEFGYLPGKPKGSVFWFTIPMNLQISDNKQEFNALHPFEMKNQQEKSALNSHEFIKNASILLVEDNPELLNYLKDSFSVYFNKVITAGDGENGLTKALNYLPDIIVSDVLMPGMNGFEMCKAIKSDIKISHIPVILLTALGDDENMKTGYKLGADMYIQKPFDIEIILSIISNIIRSRNDSKLKYKELGQQISPEQLTYSNADEQFMIKFIGKIEQKLDDTDIDMNWFASEMAMGRSTFYSKIKSITGMSANAFVIDYKIKKAIRLLTQSDIPIIDISTQLGFANQRYFSTVFKQTTGKTPSQFRSENKA